MMCSISSTAPVNFSQFNVRDLLINLNVRELLLNLMDDSENFEKLTTDVRFCVPLKNLSK
jgi:hypothetical protein